MVVKRAVSKAFCHTPAKILFGLLSKLKESNFLLPKDEKSNIASLCFKYCSLLPFSKKKKRKKKKKIPAK